MGDSSRNRSGQPRWAQIALAVALALVASLAWAAPSALARFSASASRASDRSQHRATRDSDHDGLPNWMEVATTGTNPHKADTDGEGLSDGREIRRTHTNPRKADTDGDGLTDWVEVTQTKTNPKKADTNGDGLRDGETAAPPAASLPSGSGGTQPEPESSPDAARAVWSAPEATVDVPTTLDGSASSGAGPIECTWSFENPTGSIVWQTRKGCVIKFTFDETGPKYVRLVVEDADGVSDSNKQTIDVAGETTEEPETPPADTTPPNTSITAGPPASTIQTAASFSFTATEGGSTFACKLDSGSWASCTSPRAYGSLALGSHTFSVRATDPAGNTDQSPATDSWSVTESPDTTPPNTSITASPPASTTQTAASFSFSATELGSTFACKLDQGSWAPCTSHRTYSSLALGAHTFSVRATDPAGNTDQSPASDSWTVVAPPEERPEEEAPAEEQPEEEEAPAEEQPATAYYIRDGGSSSSCTSWADACDALPAAPKRGATYYVASGRYSGGTYSTPASGSQKIIIRGATAANHGTDTGWTSSYSVNTGDGGSQAVWTSGLQFRTSNWVFDGSVGPNGSKTTTAYGFKIEPVSYAVRVYNTSAAISNVTISHIAATAPSGDIEKFFLSTENSTKSVNEVTLSHTLLNGWSNAVWATSANLEMNSWLIEHNIILNGFSSAANHGEDINNNYGYLDNLTVRYNLFEGRASGTGCIVVLNDEAGAYYIYGNVFKDMRGGDGCITGVHDKLSGAIYNNTFVNVDNGYGNGDWIGHDVSATVYDNVVYNSVAAFGANFTGACDYNAYFSTTDSPSESHGYTSSSNPFASGGFQLTEAAASAMPAGTTLASPFNVDPNGVTRGADGKWDRGAYEHG